MISKDKIKDLVLKCADCETSFNKAGQDVIKNDEILKILAKQKSKDIKWLLSFWSEKIKESYFELYHPIYAEIKTRAVYNVRHGMYNFIFFIDENNEYPWILTQCQFTIDAIITNDLMIGGVLVSQVKNLQNTNIDALTYRNIKFGFILAQGTPYHFFYDILKTFLFFKDEKNIHLINDSQAFYKLKLISDIPRQSHIGVQFFPLAIGNLHLTQKQDITVKRLNEQMENFIYEDALENFLPPIKDKNTFKLWYGITGEKRSWLEQIEGIEQIIFNLSNYFDKIELYIDGMTASEGKIIENGPDNVIFNKIKERLSMKCKVFSLIGQDYRHKIQEASTIDLFIANAGTGCMVPLRFCKKPGVLHSNSTIFAFPDNYPDIVKIVDNRYTYDVAKSENQEGQHTSYHIPWQHIYNLAAEVLNQTKNMNIKMLEVPPVEEVVKEYELKNKKNKG